MPIGPQIDSSFSKLSNLTLGLLVLIAAVLGYFLYQRMGGSDSAPAPTQTQNQNQTQPQAQTGAQGSISLTSDERAVLSYPAANVTPAQWENYLSLVAKVAVETDTITIGPNCSIKPIVLRTTLAAGKKVHVKNNDTVPHTLAFNDPPQYTIPAKGTVDIPADFKGKPGMYGYGCDGSPAAVGFMQVVQ